MPEQPSDSSEAPQTPPSSQPQGPRADDAGGGAGAASASPPSPESVQLLSQILQRLQRMEGGLSQHELWLRRIEEEQRQPDAATAPPTSTPPPAPGPRHDDELQRLVGSLTLERDRAEKALSEAQRQVGQYQQELALFRKQTAELETRLGERDRELGELKSSAAKGLEQARSLQAQTQRQLNARQEQLAAVQEQLVAARKQMEARDRQLAELQGAVNQAAHRFETLSGELTARSQEDEATALAERAWSRFSRIAVVAAFAAAVVSVALTGWLYESGRRKGGETVRATVLLPGIDGQAFESCARRAAEALGITVTADPRLKAIELAARDADQGAATTRLNQLAAELVAAAGIPPRAATQPSELPDAQALTARIDDADRQIAASAAITPATAPAGDTSSVSARWKELTEQRVRLAEQAAEMGRQADSRQPQSAPADVTPEEIAQAEAQNQSLQAENEALQQREEQLAGRLVVSMDTSAVQFQSLQRSLTDADAQLQKLLEESHPEEVDKQLTIVRESLKTWARATTDLDSAWKRQRSALASTGRRDALGAQAELEKSARAFVTQVTAANTEFAKAIEAIGQGQDQTTKRLVLRNTLVKQLNPVTTEQASALVAARSVILNDNLELTAIVQRLDALSKQVRQRRTQIVAALKQERETQAQRNRSLRVGRLRQEQEELGRQIAAIDVELLRLGETAVTSAAAFADTADRLTRQAALLQGQTADLKTLVDRNAQFALQVGSLPAPPPPGFVPAKAPDTDTGGPSLISAVLLGLTPALACAAALAMAWLIISARRSRQTIEEYARTLKETARRASLNQQEQLLSASEKRPGG